MRFHGRMTVVLALRCADGVVLGSDSQITDSARGLSYPAQKLHPFGDNAAWGGSGSRDVDYGGVAVVRILDALGITSPSIGGPKDVYRITADGAHALSEKDIDRVRKQVARWSELESKALDELFDG
jgi:hypothetical protein